MHRIALPSRTVIVCAVAAIAAALGAATAATAVGTAAPFTYVALGDSYSSGEGIPPFLGGGCHRSSRAYPTWVRRPGAAKTLYATASGWASWACSGAKTANVLPRSLGGVPQQRLGETLDRATQLDSADLARADLVTLTIGGNDAGFIEVLLVCALSNCKTRTFEQGRAAIIDATRPQLEKVYRAVARKAPRARILVLGYPGLFPATKAEQACAGLSRFRGEQTMLRRLGERLNATIAAAVRTVARSGARIEYVPVSARFAGHEVCGRKGPWLNGLVTSNSGLGLDAASFHPNLEGQRDGYAAVVNAALARGR